MTVQERREKAIKGLECCVETRDMCWENPACPYDQQMNECDGCITLMMRDALALLKAQEARVMTLEEALNSLVIEYRGGKLREVGKLIFKEGYEYYGNLWRVWDRMPTYEQRKAIPWN